MDQDQTRSIHAVKRATRCEALDPLRQGLNAYFAGFHAAAAKGLQLRHDHRSQFMSDDFQNEIRFLGIESSPGFVRVPQGNGCIERFFKTLKEQLLWVRRHPLIDSFPRPTISLDSDLREYMRTYRRGGSGYVQRKEWSSWGREGSP